MVGFDLARPARLSAWAREWRPGPTLPLYVAALLAGAGMGIGFTVLSSDAQRMAPRALVEEVESPARALAAPAAVFGAPDVAAELSGTTGDPGPGVLPLEFEIALGKFVLAAPAGASEATAGEPGSAPAETAPAVAPSAAHPMPNPTAPPTNPPVTAAQPATPPTPVKPNFYVPSVPSGPATALELQLFELINAERAKAGLAPYVLDAGLTTIARTRSQQLIDQGYFGHVDPYGYSMYVELLAHFGYRSYAWAGENLAMNNYPAERAAAVALEGLMNSPTHRANLLAGDFSRVGIGEITDGLGRHYFAMIFLG